MKQLTRQQKIILALLLLTFAAAKVAALWWWQQQHTPNNITTHDNTCNVRQGCTLSQGSHVLFGPQSTAQSAFDITLSHIPEHVQHVSVSFSMRDMDMGFNRYTLKKQGNGRWVGQQIRLPLCIDNRHDYLADIMIDQQRHSVSFSVP